MAGTSLPFKSTMTEKTPIRMRLPHGEGYIDLGSMERQASAVATAAEELRRASGRARVTHEIYEKAVEDKELAVKEWNAARTAYEIARGGLDNVQAGNLDEIGRAARKVGQ